MAGNYRLLKCTITAANLLLLLLVLLINIDTCTAGAAQSFLPVPSSATPVSGVMMGSCGSAAECTTAGGGIIGEEFVMMDSETSKKVLESASGNHPYLSYASVLDDAAACKGAVQNSCFSDKKYGKMNCGPYHRTCGGGGGS